jgi:RNA polymerase sigma factor (sigma-70 family)
MGPSPQSDKLWEAFRRGNRVAYGEIYSNHAPALLAYGSRITSDHKLVEDCLQDLFIELWKSRENLSSTNSIKFYLFKALRLKIFRYQSHQNTESLDDYMYVVNDPSHEENFIKLESESIQINLLKDAIEHLPLRQREAINLRYFHGFSNEEVASIMSVNYQSACKLIYAALKRLKESLEIPKNSSRSTAAQDF